MHALEQMRRRAQLLLDDVRRVCGDAVACEMESLISSDQYLGATSRGFCALCARVGAAEANRLLGAAHNAVFAEVQ